MSPAPFTPKKFLFAVATCALLLAGCSAENDDTNASTDQSSSTVDPAGEEHSSEDTTTIHHSFGEASYPHNPTTVVAVGTGVDNLLALGITPDAVIERPDDKDSPWKNNQLEGVERIPSTGQDLPFEAIAALDTDFIVGDYYRISEEAYPRLSDIAPTLPGIDDSADWADQLQALGKIYDREEQATTVIDDDRKLFDEAKKDLPGLAGRTAVITMNTGGQFGVIADPNNAANDFFSDLSMTLPPTLTNGDIDITQGRAMVSAENISLLAADFMAVYAQDGIEATREIPGYSELPQVVRGSVIEDNRAVMAGLNVPSSLSRAWVLEHIRPELEKAADGNPV